MAEGSDAEDRTEAATPRRLQRAREEGNLPLSRELPPLVTLGGLALVLMMAAPGLARALTGRLVPFLAEAHRFDLSGGGGAVLRAAGLDLLRAAAPFLGVAVLAGASTLLQTGFLFNASALMPDFSRLDPRRGLKRLGSVASLIEAAKSLLKILVIGAACWHVLRADLRLLAGAPYWDAATLIDRMARIVLHVLLTILGAQAVVAVLDVVWVRLRHARGVRMSREDIRQEMKETEGDPQVKGRLRQLRLQRARKRMLSGVKAATVVVTNPTHYAVALRYDRTKNAAPRVVAKGADYMAARIRAVAEESRVPLVANPPLARALYRVEVDADIPPDQYKAVAELIAYVWRLQGRLGRRAA